MSSVSTTIFTIVETSRDAFQKWQQPAWIAAERSLKNNAAALFFGHATLVPFSLDDVNPDSEYKCGVKLVRQVISPPTKPLMIYDGECGFCALWIGRWRRSTGGRIAYLPFQDPQVTAGFPELPREHLETAVQLIETNGTV